MSELTDEQRKECAKHLMGESVISWNKDFNRDNLISLYNGTSTLDEETDDIETYEKWLEKQLIKRVVDEGKTKCVYVVEVNRNTYTWKKNNWGYRDFYDSYEKAQQCIDWLISDNHYAKTDLRIVTHELI